jgi:hypothetical protein
VLVVGYGRPADASLRIYTVPSSDRIELPKLWVCGRRLRLGPRCMKAGPGEAHCLEATFACEFIDHLNPTTLEFLTSEAQLKIVILKHFAVPEVVVLVWDAELHMQGSMSALDVYNGQSWGPALCRTTTRSFTPVSGCSMQVLSPRCSLHYCSSSKSRKFV